MRLDTKPFIRALSPRLVSKALNTLDRSTAVVIGVCWSAALVMMVLAFFAVHGAMSSRREAAEALAVEPSLPVISSVAMTKNEVQSIADRLQRQFPDIKFEAKSGQLLSIKSDDGLKFHQWITALSYIDTMAPQFRWTLKEFCTGTCGSGQGLMNALLSGQKMMISPARK
jgi:hypothetical protein